MVWKLISCLLWPFTSLSTVFVFCQQKLARLKDDSSSLITYFFFDTSAPCVIFVLRFTSRMWNWVRCGSLLIYVAVDKQTEKLKITRTTHLNRDIDIYVEECKLKKYLAICLGLSALASVWLGHATRILIY